MTERLTPFMLFFCEHKDVVQQANPSAAPHEVSQIIADNWKALAPEKARAYSVLSATYTEQKKANSLATSKKRKTSSSSGEKKETGNGGAKVNGKEKDPKAPKSATSAYMYFSKHHRMLLKQENSYLTFGDLGKTVGAMWKAATPEEKRPFEELAAEDKNRYVNELHDYKSLQEADIAPGLDDEDEKAIGASEGASGISGNEARGEHELDDDEGPPVPNVKRETSAKDRPPDISSNSSSVHPSKGGLSSTKKKSKSSPRGGSSVSSSPASTNQQQRQEQEPAPMNLEALPET